MELPGSGYLLNLSLVAITFAAISVLVMLVRQTMGGRLSNIDIHLVATYVSVGFTQAIAAMLPPAASLVGLSGRGLWVVASGLAATCIVVVFANILWERSRITKRPMASLINVSYVLQGLVVLLLVANAAVPAIQGMGLYVVAMTFSVAVVMWSFVKRLVSLLGEKPNEDWDLKRG